MPPPLWGRDSSSEGENIGFETGGRIARKRNPNCGKNAETKQYTKNFLSLSSLVAGTAI